MVNNDYAVSLPCAAAVRSVAQLRVIGLQCPLARTMQQRQTSQSEQRASQLLASQRPSQRELPLGSVNPGPGVTVLPIHGQDAAPLSASMPPPAVPPKKRPRENESAYSENQLRPKRLKSLASQIPYQLFLKQWCNKDAAVSTDRLDPEFIEAWCLLGQPRRDVMGEDRVRLLAERAKVTNNDTLPRWFTPSCIV
jgi:hypothetical protein